MHCAKVSGGAASKLAKIKVHCVAGDATVFCGRPDVFHMDKIGNVLALCSGCQEKHCANPDCVQHQAEGGSKETVLRLGYATVLLLWNGVLD